MDGDGKDDMPVGSPSSALHGPGTAYLLYGPVSGTVSLASADVALRGGGDDEAGFDLCGAGDVDGDGRPDILIGGPGDDDGGEDAGAVWLLLGSTIMGTLPPGLRPEG